jgi:hypothetical protein
MFPRKHVIVIGAQKAGTTWLQHVFDTNSNICTSVEQEVHFFDQIDDATSPPSFDAYRDYFKDCTLTECSVDVTPDYLDSPDAPERVACAQQHYGFDVKFIVLLREPVERAFSAYQMFRNYGRKYDSFLGALESDRSLVNKGLYAQSLMRWTSRWPLSDFKFVMFDDIRRDSSKVLREIAEFMALSRPLSNLYAGKPVNSGGVDKFKVVSKVRGRIGASLRRRNLHQLIHYLKTTALVGWIDKANKNRISLDNDTARYAKRYFYNDVCLLHKMLPGREILARWRYDK